MDQRLQAGVELVLEKVAQEDKEANLAEFLNDKLAEEQGLEAPHPLPINMGARLGALLGAGSGFLTAPKSPKDEDPESEEAKSRINDERLRKLKHLLIGAAAGAGIGAGASFYDLNQGKINSYARGLFGKDTPSSG
jgi:hypothetical protein